MLNKLTGRDFKPRNGRTGRTDEEAFLVDESPLYKTCPPPDPFHPFLDILHIFGYSKHNDFTQLQYRLAASPISQATTNMDRVHTTPTAIPHDTGKGRGFQMPQPTRPSASQVHRSDWQEGDIAFLKQSRTFSDEDYSALIQSGHLQDKATGHPVIVLRRPSPRSTHMLVTTVSAFSSDEANNWLAPWEQEVHHWKHRLDFRSFEGTERSSREHAALQLEGARSMPKPRGSWVYIQNVYLVPVTVVGLFNKVQGPKLRVTRASLKDLRSHLSTRNANVAQLLKSPLLCQEATVAAPRPTPAPTPTPAVHQAPACVPSLSDEDFPALGAPQAQKDKKGKRQQRQCRPAPGPQAARCKTVSVR